MKLNEKQNRDHIALIILIGSIGSFVISMGGFFLFPPTYVGEVPHYPVGLAYASEIGGALVLLATSLMAIRLADERQVLPAAGFTMMAIGQGVFYVTIFEIFGEFTKEGLEKVLNIQIGGFILCIPALFLISFYTYFPRWLRWLTLFASIPYFICNVLIMVGNRNMELLDGFGAVGGVTLGVTQILWGVWMWKTRHHRQT